MIVKIYSLSRGLETFTEVKAIRVKSKKYNLLIMKDYLPIIGEIDGSFEIEMENETKLIDPIKAYYVNQNNIFELIIKEDVKNNGWVYLSN